jgi:hypothetical protein
MPGGDRRAFDWKEVAKVLRMTRAAARISFSREVKRASSKSVEVQANAIVIQDKSHSDTLNFRKPRGSGGAR